MLVGTPVDEIFPDANLKQRRGYLSVVSVHGDRQSTVLVLPHREGMCFVSHDMPGSKGWSTVREHASYE